MEVISHTYILAAIAAIATALCLWLFLGEWRSLVTSRGLVLAIALFLAVGLYCMYRISIAVTI